ncbi:hypothetical protein EV644_10437 [Kribbella orskensis]|uniref:Uncharacterized protein n=1 Tax=Kribbella orskensis TaxID=2512216 RepID=A0ABY2BMK7_9ACTN|nr:MULTISPECIES: hypothetical protein [Kribbella]TCN41655.1 hypothetical protein EV642_10337 [Kribbella sp. VKM Ac-2500]TCO25533.1 hypothetical protein EV644_10437 [Kribbella orskensis]
MVAVAFTRSLVEAAGGAIASVQRRIAVIRDLHGDWERRTTGESLDRGREATVREDRGMDPARELAQLGDGRPHVLDDTRRGGTYLTASLGELQRYDSLDQLGLSRWTQHRLPGATIDARSGLR